MTPNSRQNGHNGLREKGGPLSSPTLGRMFKHLSRLGPTGSEAFAREAGIDHRYAQEWLSIITSGGYVDYDLEV
jgi:hypothetical protein